MSVGSINYEGVNETLVYQNLTCDGVVYESGDFVKDWNALMRDYLKEQKYDYVVFSSSFDHFFFDGADYDVAYLFSYLVDGEGVWELIDAKNHKRFKELNIINLDEDCFKFYLPKGVKMTWEEFKEYCK